MITVYGPAQSRVSRTLWCLAELKLESQRVDVTEEFKRSEFLKINPNGAYPALVDGKVKLFESIAINLYLAKNYGSGTLYIDDLAAESETWQWSIWAVAELEQRLIDCIKGRKPTAGAEGMATADLAEATLQRPLGALEATLSQRQYLVAPHFTVADLNVVSILGYARRGGVKLDKFPVVAAWLDRCFARPAAFPS